MPAPSSKAHISAAESESGRSVDAARTAFEAALAARREGDWQGSLACMYQAQHLDPSNAAYHAEAGAALFMLERPAEAAREYERALAIDPSHLPSLNNLAVILSLAGQYKEAEDLLQQSASLNPSQLDVWLNLCSAVEGQDYREEDQVAYARKAVSLQPRNPSPYRFLGKALLRLGNPQAALDALVIARGLAPNDSEIAYSIAICHGELDNVPEAVQHFQQALAINPAHGQTYYALADLLFRLDELPAAEEASRAALEALEDKESSYYQLARITFARGKYNDAKAAYDSYRIAVHSRVSKRQGKRPPGGKALLLPVAGTDAWCRGKPGLLREVLSERSELPPPLVRFGFTDGEQSGKTVGVVPRSYIAEIRQPAIVPGHEFLLVDNERLVLYDRLANLQDRNNLLEDEVVRLADPQHVLVDVGPQSDRTLKEGVFLLGQFWYNYAHWLLEQLPRLWSLEHFPEYQDLPLLINDGLYPQQMESLRLVDRHSHPLIVLPRGKRFRVERLIYPSNLTSSMLMRYRPGTRATDMDVTLHPEAVTFLRDRLLPQCAATSGSRKRLWVSRKTKIRAGHRRLVNESEIEALFVRNGFEVVVPESLSFREQVAIFSQAEMIAGCAGAGMVNSLFAPPDARILMFTKDHPQVNFHYFANIARCIGQPIAYVCGKTLQNFGLLGFEADFSVDIELARRAMRDFLQL